MRRGDLCDLLAASPRRPVIAAVASAGIIAGVVGMTGLGSKFAAGIISLADGVLILALLFTMVACIVLGMGLPTTANYVVTATIAAPALINEFGLPPMAVHLFVFYFGIIADITPPVCLAAFAGAGVSPRIAEQVAAKKIKVLAVGADSPDPEFPGVPTMAQAGLNGFEVATWWGILAPAKTPADRVNKLNAEIVAMLGSADTQRRMREMGFDPAAGDAAYFERYVRTEIDKWARVIKLSGARAD